MATTKKPRARKGPTKRTKRPSRRAAVMAAATPTARAQAAMALSAAVAQKAEQESRDRDNDEILVNENIRRRALINRTLRERVAAHQAMVKAVRAATKAAAAPQRLNILAQGELRGSTIRQATPTSSISFR